MMRVICGGGAEVGWCPENRNPINKKVQNFQKKYDSPETEDNFPALTKLCL